MIDLENIKKLSMKRVVSHGAYGETEIYHEVDIDKFAELIVRECASICEINAGSYKYSFTAAKARLAESTSLYCGDLILKHFKLNHDS